MIREQLDALKLPEILRFNSGDEVSLRRDLKTPEDWKKRRLEIIDLVSKYEFGYSPEAPESVRYEVISENGNAYCGKAVERNIKVSFDTPNGEFSFPYYLLIPKYTKSDVNSNPDKKSPVILHIAFRDDVPDRYVPAEEIIDNGFALALFCMNNVTEDRDDGFTSGIAAMYDRDYSSWGKIGMWAFAASRVLDTLGNFGGLDLENVAVMGHSRLGKTALWAGAQDERFKYVMSNDSGCSGAAIARAWTLDPRCERIHIINKVFRYWFNEEYKNYNENEDNFPIDQHFLMAATAPRYLYVASAAEDFWANPKGEYLGCASVSDVWKLLGKSGFIAPDRYPEIDDYFHDGNIGYHLRSGTHALSRYDWNRYMQFIKASL